MLNRKVVLVGLFVLNTFCAVAQTSENLLQRANSAYALLQFEPAVQLYEQYAASNPGKSAIAEKIADCYWNIRNYSKSSMWYEKVDAAAVAGNEETKRRIAELKAMEGKYADAKKLLQSLNGFQPRANGFDKVNLFKRDSADWTISYLNINTPYYREFSPLVLGKKFVWSSNQPVMKGINGIMGWDANGYVRQFYLSSLDFLEKGMLPDGKDTSAKKINSKYARHFEGADVSVRATSNLPQPLIIKNRNKQFEVFELNGFAKTFYNIGHITASSQTQKLYASVNFQQKITDSSTRLIGIVEADYGPDGVSNVHFLNVGFDQVNVMHPAIHPTGDYLVFSSNRPGGKGGYDLYIIKKSADGKWSAPFALDNLNTKGNEVFAAFDPTGNDLYYSSDGMPGLGGLDIYKIRMSAGIVVGEPAHLDYPLNTQFDEFGFHNVNNETGFFTSDRYGTDDVFSFNYSKVYTPIQGTVVNRITKLREGNVPVALYLKDDNGGFSKIDSVLTDKNGNYSFTTARPNREFKVVAYDPKPIEPGTVDIAKVNTPSVSSTAQSPVLYVGNEMPAIANAPVPEPVSPPAPAQPSAIKPTEPAKKVPVQEPVLAKAPVAAPPAEVLPAAPAPAAPAASAGPNLVLDSVYFIIYFDFDKYALTPTSIATLNRAVAFLKNNPDYGFILLGHTDLKGKIDYNINLSKNRVYAANNYMASKGIDPKRFKLEYYGKSHPAKSGLTEDDGRLNRRVEFILVKK